MYIYYYQWFKFDDQTITLASEQEVLESNVYMCFYIRNVMNYGSIENSGMIPVNSVKSEKEKAALAKEKEKEEKAALKKAKKLKKEAEVTPQTKKRKNNQLLSESPSKSKHIKLTGDAKNSLEKSIHKSIKTEKSLSTSKTNSKPHNIGGKTLPKIKKEYAASLLSDDDEETYTVLASGKSSYTEVIGKGYSNGSIHKPVGGKIKPGSNSSLNRNNSTNYSHDRIHSYGQPTNGISQKIVNSKQRKKGSDTTTNTKSITTNNKLNDTNHNKNILDSLLTDDDDDDLDEISSLTDISSSPPEEVFVMASDHI